MSFFDMDPRGSRTIQAPPLYFTARSSIPPTPPHVKNTLKLKIVTFI